LGAPAMLLGAPSNTHGSIVPSKSLKCTIPKKIPFWGLYDNINEKNKKILFMA